MSRRTEVVKEMQKVSMSIERIERDLEVLKNIDVKYVGSIQLEYFIPEMPSKKVLFPTPGGKGAETLSDFIIAAYEDMLVAFDKFLGELAKEL